MKIFCGMILVTTTLVILTSYSIPIVHAEDLTGSTEETMGTERNSFWDKESRQEVTEEVVQILKKIESGKDGEEEYWRVMDLLDDPAKLNVPEIVQLYNKGKPPSPVPAPPFSPRGLSKMVNLVVRKLNGLVVGETLKSRDAMKLAIFAHLHPQMMSVFKPSDKETEKGSENQQDDLPKDIATIAERIAKGKVDDGDYKKMIKVLNDIEMMGKAVEFCRNQVAAKRFQKVGSENLKKLVNIIVDKLDDLVEKKTVTLLEAWKLGMFAHLHPQLIETFNAFSSGMVFEDV